MNGIWRAGLFGLPIIALALAGVAACSEDDDLGAPGSDDASTDAPVLDGSLVDSAAPDGSTPTDAGTDAADASDAPVLPALCQTYSNAGIAPDAAAGEGEEPIPRWDLIAYRALEAAALTCEVGGAFADNAGDPTAYECLGIQLAGLVGCAGTIDYASANDNNGTACAPDAGSVVELGFRDPATGSYTVKDVDFFIDLVGKAAASTGIAAVDVARLESLLQGMRANVVGAGGLDAGLDGGDFSQSTCP